MGKSIEILTEEELQLRGMDSIQYFEMIEMEILTNMPSDEELELEGIDQTEYIKIQQDEFTKKIALKNMGLTLSDYKAEVVLIEVSKQMEFFELSMDREGYSSYYDKAQNINEMNLYFEDKCEDSKYPQICIENQEKEFQNFLQVLKECNNYLKEKFENFENSRKYNEEELLNVDIVVWSK